MFFPYLRNPFVLAKIVFIPFPRLLLLLHAIQMYALKVILASVLALAGQSPHPTERKETDLDDFSVYAQTTVTQNATITMYGTTTTASSATEIMTCTNRTSFSLSTTDIAVRFRGTYS